MLEEAGSQVICAVLSGVIDRVVLATLMTVEVAEARGMN